MPSPDPLVVFLYVLMRDHAPTGGVRGAIERAGEVDGSVTFTAPELEVLAERYADDLRELIRKEEPEPTGLDRVPPPNGAPVVSPPMDEHRTALDSIDAVMKANPDRWLRLKQIHAAAGGDAFFAFASLRIAMQRYVKEGRADARGATAARVYRFAGEQIREHDREHTSEGSPDSHAEEAETLPPRSPSASPDESPDGGDGDSAEQAGGAALPSSPKRRRRKMTEAPRRPLPTPPPMEPIKDPPRRQTPAPAAQSHSISYVISAISPWITRQQTFRKRQLVEAFPHFTPDEIRPALTALGGEGKLRIDASGAGEPVYTVVGREDRGGEAKPATNSTGTIEGAILQFVASKGSQGANLGAVATVAQLSNDDAATVLSKLWRENDVRVTTVDGQRVYVAA